MQNNQFRTQETSSKLKCTDGKKVEKGEDIENKIFEFIVYYITKHGYPPTVREIMTGIGVFTTASVHYHIKKMFEKNMIETDAKEGSPRAIRIPGYEFKKKEDKRNENC